MTFTHSFSVYGVDSIEESCYQSWPHLTENNTTQLDIQVAHCTMQEYIHQMVAHGLQLMQQVVESERGHAQRTVRLVAGFAGHFSSPEVVVEKISPGSLRPEILVLLDGWFIVIDNATVDCVPVDGYGDRRAEHSASTQPRGRAHSFMSVKAIYADRECEMRLVNLGIMSSRPHHCGWSGGDCTDQLLQLQSVLPGVA